MPQFLQKTAEVWKGTRFDIKYIIIKRRRENIIHKNTQGGRGPSLKKLTKSQIDSPI
jgi:hypothetical protein